MARQKPGLFFFLAIRAGLITEVRKMTELDMAIDITAVVMFLAVTIGSIIILSRLRKEP